MRLTGVPATALAIAAQRATESKRPDRLFDDPFAARFVAAGGEIDKSGFPRRDTSKTWEVYDGYFALRTRFFDDFLVASECRQVVILAAGLDTRAHRLPWRHEPRLFEIDYPELFAFKEDVLGESPAGCERITVATDLAGEWTGPLVAAGFRPEEPTAWLVEGLLMYLTTEQGEQLLDTMTTLSAPGSQAAVETKQSALIREVGGELMPFHPGVGPIAWLRAREWQVGTVPIATLGERYGRPVPARFDPAADRPDGLLTARKPSRS